jgi:hypothetical protein
MKPDPTRREPLIWLKRLVILSTLNSSAVIRDIEFRRGLNIIRTRQMETRGGPVAGHSVGKTLLMRLIRYTLGEAHFGTDETEQNVAAVLETAYVVGHWSVGGVDWIVGRPLRTADGAESFAATNDDWRQIVEFPKQEHSYREFAQAVSDAIVSGLPSFHLPRGREAKWQDILAWLSRDFQCGYRRANEWRHEDANSGPSVDREDNSLIMQWLMGLMSPEEIELRLKHHELLGQRADQKRSCERDEKKLETLWPALRDKLELNDESQVVAGQATFDSTKPVEIVADKIASLKRLKADRIAVSEVVQFEAELDDIRDKLIEAEATIRFCRATIRFIEKQIEEYERDPLRPYAKCQAVPTCWMRERATENAADPAAEEHLADLRNQLEEQRGKLAPTESDKKRLEATLSDARRRLSAEQRRLAEELSHIDLSIGRWQGYETDAKAFQGTTHSAARVAKSLAKTDGDVDSSLKLQDHVRRKHRKEVTRLSGVYQDLLQRIFGEEAVGKIQVDGNGLQPIPDKKLAPAGAALSVMTTVLAFDIACVAAGIGGIGRHPRFLMHDSPREGDMEAPLFRRLFEIVHELESMFEDDRQVSFQYIVTTTTAPPEELGRESGRYVRETLDARTTEGLLLKRRF